MSTCSASPARYRTPRTVAEVEKFVLDTNVYIDAIRNARSRESLAEWLRSMAPHVWQHAVVVSELLVGAKDVATWRRWHDRWVLPAERVSRVITPTYATWLRASRILSRLAERGAVRMGGLRPGFYNDCLIAATAREHGHVIVTHNAADFELIARVEPGLRTVKPLP